MNEYITKDQAIELLHYNNDEKCAAIIADVEELEPADVVPVVHGKWVFEDVDLICSNCGMDAPTEGDYRQVRSSYCPCCGARMDGE